MEEPVALGHDVQVVDPDVRGYVYSLVTAVRITFPFRTSIDFHLLTTPLSFSLVASMAKMQTNMSWEMTPWLVSAILSDG